MLLLYNRFASDNSNVVYKVQHCRVGLKKWPIRTTDCVLHWCFTVSVLWLCGDYAFSSHVHCTAIRYFFGLTAQFGRKLDDVTRAQEHDNLLTYIPPESVAPAGCDDDAFATAWWRLAVTCQWRSRASSACAACRRLFSRTWTRTPPADQTDTSRHQNDQYIVRTMKPSTIIHHKDCQTRFNLFRMGFRRKRWIGAIAELFLARNSIYA